MYTYTHICICVCVYIYIHTYIRICVYIQICRCICVYTYIYIYMYVPLSDTYLKRGCKMLRLSRRRKNDVDQALDKLLNNNYYIIPNIINTK